MSAETVGALARKRSEDPGVERHERRGKLRERADMWVSLLARNSHFDLSISLLTREIGIYGPDKKY
jgi:hypothetical protein